MRAAFPDVACIRFELTFSEQRAVAPAEQSHVMYPPARAFFQFPCPHSNCSGTFDLSAVAKALLARNSSRASGDLECHGTRSKDVATKEACGLRVSYVVLAEYQP